VKGFFVAAIILGLTSVSACSSKSDDKKDERPAANSNAPSRRADAAAPAPVKATQDAGAAAIPSRRTGPDVAIPEPDLK
jgi:hypothetical protein